jgi:hypothetical protein
MNATETLHDRGHRLWLDNVSAGLPPDVGSVASVFISRWDVAVKDRVPEPKKGHDR